MPREGRPRRVLLAADRPSVSRLVARRLAEAGLHVHVVPTITEAISAVVLDWPSCVVFDSHLAGSQGVHAIAALLRLIETYDIPAVDFAVRTSGEDRDRPEGAGWPAPLRPGPSPPPLQAEAEIPDETAG
jgi:CheY-like chemotaxis protein